MAQIEEEKRQDEELEGEIRNLLAETRLWRIANSAQWVAWGIVQAKVPGMDEALNAQQNSIPNSEDPIIQAPQACIGSDPLNQEDAAVVQDVSEQRSESRELADEGQDDEQEFDYLGYAQERAMFFWGDVLQLGIVKREDMPEELLNKVKVVEY